MDEFSRQSGAWAQTVLRVLDTPFPYGAAHSCLGPDDCDVTPDRLHPSFHGCLDWHSSVHMQWSAISLLAGGWTSIAPEIRDELLRELDTRLTPQKVAAETAYLADRRGFERPYGWAWAALLTAAAHVNARDHSSPVHSHAAGWAEALTPLADVVASHLVGWLPSLAHPVRHGVHSNTAFALGLMHDAFTTLGRDDVVAAIEDASLTWFLGDLDYPSAWEPSGSDFLSPALCEATLVQRVLDAREFDAWLTAFLPVLAEPDDVLLAVPRVLDPTDGHAVHLYGLGLSRAAMLRTLAAALDDVRAERALAAAEAQYLAAADAITDGDFMSTHWLVSFAVLAVLADQ